MYFVTSNKKKFQEAKSIIPELEQMGLDIPEIQDSDPKVIIQNKLRYAKQKLSGKVVVEDTGLYLDCLNGLPGPFIKWFMEKLGNEGIYEIAARFENHRAEAKTVLGAQNSEGELTFFEGSVQGLIVSPRGEAGFGWDPIFEPEGYEKTFAEMSLEEKNKISSRRLAFDSLKRYREKKQSLDLT